MSVCEVVGLLVWAAMQTARWFRPVARAFAGQRAPIIGEGQGVHVCDAGMNRYGLCRHHRYTTFFIRAIFIRAKWMFSKWRTGNRRSLPHPKGSLTCSLV